MFWTLLVTRVVRARSFETIHLNGTHCVRTYRVYSWGNEYILPCTLTLMYQSQPKLFYIKYIISQTGAGTRHVDLVLQRNISLEYEYYYPGTRYTLNQVGSVPLFFCRLLDHKQRPNNYIFQFSVFDAAAKYALHIVHLCFCFWRSVLHSSLRHITTVHIQWKTFYSYLHLLQQSCTSDDLAGYNENGQDMRTSLVETHVCHHGHRPEKKKKQHPLMLSMRQASADDRS